MARTHSPADPPLSKAANPTAPRLGTVLLGAALLLTLSMAMHEVHAFGQQPPAAGPTAPAACRLAGRIASGGTPLPGVAVVARRGDRVVAATSTGVDGAWGLMLPGGQTYRLSTAFMGFAAVHRDLALAAALCDASLDFELALASRTLDATPGDSPPAVLPAGDTTSTPRAGSAPVAEQAATRRISRAGGPGRRFEALDVELEGILAGDLDLIPEDSGDPATQLLLPPGFSTDGATDAVAIQGETTRLDSGMMRERLLALGRGEFASAGATLPDGMLRGRPGGFGGRGPFGDLTAQGFGPGQGLGPGAGWPGRIPGTAPAGTEPLPGLYHVHLRRVCARRRAVCAARRRRNTTGLRPATVRQHGGRTAADPWRLRRVPDHVLPQCPGEPLDRSRRPVCNRAHDGGSAGRLLGKPRRGRGSTDRTAVPRQPHPRGPAGPRRPVAAAVPA